MNNIEIVNVVVDIAFGVTYIAIVVLPCAIRYFADRERTRRVMTSDTCHQKRNLKWEVTVALSNTVHLFSKTRVTALYPFARKLKSADPQHAPLLLRTSSHHEGDNVACLRTITHEHQPFSSWTDRRCQGGAIHQGGSLIRTVKRDHARSCEVPSTYRQGERVAADCRALQRKRPDPRPGSYLGVRVHWSSGR